MFARPNEPVHNNDICPGLTPLIVGVGTQCHSSILSQDAGDLQGFYIEPNASHPGRWTKRGGALPNSPSPVAPMANPGPVRNILHSIKIMLREL